MATTPVIQYLQLDGSYDPLFSTDSVLTNLEAAAQAILTRLKLFLGEWWEDLTLGLPVFQIILGQLGTPAGLTAMELAVQDNIAGAPYVTNVIDVTATFEDGVLGITYSAMTSFGLVTGGAQTIPAASAAL